MIFLRFFPESIFSISLNVSYLYCSGVSKYSVILILFLFDNDNSEPNVVKTAVSFLWFSTAFLKSCADFLSSVRFSSHVGVFGKLSSRTITKTSENYKSGNDFLNSEFTLVYIAVLLFVPIKVVCEVHRQSLNPFI